MTEVREPTDRFVVVVSPSLAAAARKLEAEEGADALPPWREMQAIPYPAPGPAFTDFLEFQQDVREKVRKAFEVKL